MIFRKKHSQNSRNKLAIILILISTLLCSIRPLIYYFGEASASPFLFSAIMNLFNTIICIIFLTVYFPKLAFNKHIIKKIAINSYRPEIFIASMSSFHYTLFALTINYIDISVTTILFETWPIFMIFITAWLFKTEKYYQKITIKALVPVIFSFVGFILVIFSQKDYSEITTIIFQQKTTILWSFIAIAGAILTAFSSPYTLKWGKILNKTEENPNPNLEFFFIIAGFSITRLIGSFISGILGIKFEETINIHQILIATLCGLLITGIASILLRYANITTNNLSINGFLYTTPIFSLIWLGIASLINVPHTNLLITGTIIITLSNLAIYFNTQSKKP